MYPNATPPNQSIYSPTQLRLYDLILVHMIAFESLTVTVLCLSRGCKSVCSSAPTRPLFLFVHTLG